MCRPVRKPPAAEACCLRPSGPPPDRPDLAIYSQREQFQLGSLPTWESPDIVTNFVNPLKLMPESRVTVRNLSATVTAVNAQVHFSIGGFGIGHPATAIGVQLLTLGPGQQTVVSFPLPQAVLNAPDQRIAAHVRIIHPHDAVAINNEGSQLVADAFTSKVGRNFSVQFPVVNPLAVSQIISLSLLPNALSATVSPASTGFAPLQQLMAALNLHVPAAVHGTPGSPQRLDVTIVGRDGAGNLLGGLTYAVFVDD